MKLPCRKRAFVAILAFTSCASARPGADPAASPPPPAGGSNPWAEQARVALRPPCGSCHLPGLETSQAKALAVFDLAERDWGRKLSPGQLDALAGRVRGTESLPEADREAVLAFVSRQRELTPAP